MYSKSGNKFAKILCEQPLYIGVLWSGDKKNIRQTEII